MTLKSIPAAVANLRRANASLLQAARLLREAGEEDHAARVESWGADVVKLANAGAVTAAKTVTVPAAKKPKPATGTPTPTPGSQISDG